MSLVFEAIQTEGLAEISYLIGDDEEGIAAVFDPRADVEVYLDLARAKNVAITHIFETHIHADLVSGARELSGRIESERSTSATKEAHTTDSKTKKSAMATNLHLAPSLSPRAIPRVTHRSTSRIYWRTRNIRKPRGEF